MNTIISLVFAVTLFSPFASAQQQMSVSHRVAAIDQHYYVYCLASGLTVHSSGFVSSCRLAQDTPYAVQNPDGAGTQGLACSGGSNMSFYSDGQLLSCRVKNWGLKTANSIVVCNGFAYFDTTGVMTSCN